MSIEAILWDYDGTLADSSRKSIEVTLDVLSNFIPDVYENVPPEISSREAFQEWYGRISDWKELYRTCYKLSEEQIAYAGKIWGEAQLRNKTESEVFEGIPEVLEKFKDIKMGVCSQNGREIIEKTLEHQNVLKYFSAVLGIEDVPFDEQKPMPTAFIKCLERLGTENFERNFVYIGDHSVDVAFGRNAEAVLRKDYPDARVITVAMHHPGCWCGEDENLMPDYIARTTDELSGILSSI